MKKSNRTTAFDGGPHIPGVYDGTVVTVKGTGGTITSPQTDCASVPAPSNYDPTHCEVTYLLSGEDVNRYRNILEITPSDQNPVFYWHQVAMDAIKSQEAAQKRAKRADCLRERAERELDTMTNRLVARTADKRALIPIDMSRLIDMAAAGSIDLNVSLFISKGKEDT